MTAFKHWVCGGCGRFFLKTYGKWREFIPLPGIPEERGTRSPGTQIKPCP